MLSTYQDGLRRSHGWAASRVCSMEHCVWCLEAYLAQAYHVYLRDLAEFCDDPLVRLALVLQKGVAITVQDRLWLPGLLIGSHNLGSVLRQRKVVALLILFRLLCWYFSLQQTRVHMRINFSCNMHSKRTGVGYYCALVMCFMSTGVWHAAVTSGISGHAAPIWHADPTLINPYG